MEPVKNRLTRVGWNAWTLVVDPDLHVVADAHRCDLDETARRREAHGVIEDVVDGARQPVGLAHDDGGVLAGAGEGDSRVACLEPSLPTRDKLLDQWTEIDPVELGTGELGVGTRRFADVVDEPVKPDNVIADNPHQALTKFRVFDFVEAVDGGTERSE